MALATVVPDATTASNAYTRACLHDILRRLPSHPNKDIWQLTPRGWKETFAPKPPPAGPSG